jgi:hypothetical protein
MAGQYREGQRLQGSDGNIYVVQGGVPMLQGGGGQAIGPVNPMAGLDAQAKRLSIEAQQRAAGQSSIETQLKQAQIVATNLENQRKAKELEKLNSSARPLKPMQDATQKRIEEAVSTYALLRQSQQGFQNDYAGNTITGNLENAAQAVSSDIGTPGQRNWWAAFRQNDNAIRNSLYGASLTAGEKAAYDATTISPRMDPKIVRENLAKRAEIARKALARMHSTAKANGYYPEAVDAAFGDALPELDPKFKLPVYSDQPQKREEIDPAALVSKDMTPSTSLDGMPKLSPEDEDFISKNARYMNPQTMVQWFNDHKHPIDAKSAQSVYDYYAKGGREGAIVSYDAAGYNRKLDSLNARRDKIAGPGGLSDLFANGGLASGAPQVAGAAAALGAGLTGNAMGDAYTMNRDAERKRLDAIRQQQGRMGGLAEGAGMATSSMLLPAGIEAGASRVVPGLTTRFMGATSPFARGAMGDATFGAITGENDSGSPIRGAVAGGGGNFAGGGTAKALGVGFAGIKAPIAKRLADAGVPVNLWQIARERGGRVGNFIADAADKLTSVPGVGSVIGARNNESLEGLNRAGLDIGGKPIGAPRATAIGSDGISQFQAAKDAAYTSALDPMQLVPDMQIGRDVLAARARAAALDPTVGPQVQRSIDQAVTSGRQSTPIPGRTLQGIKQNLNADIDGLPANAFGRDGEGVLGDFRESVFDLARRQDPENFALYRNADEAHRRGLVLEKSANASKGRAGNPGMWTPAQLANANSAVYGASAATRGQTPFSQLAQDAVTLLPSQVSDSGTAGRLAMGLLATGGAGYAADQIDPSVGIPLALLAAGASKPGQALIRKGPPREAWPRRHRDR